MDGMRWLLLLFGLVVIAGVYLYSRREKTTSNRNQVADRVAPSLDSDDQTGDQDTDSDSAIADNENEADERFAPDAPQKIVTVRVVARDKKSFAGDELILSMRGIGLRHGKFGIFHRYDGDEKSGSIFSAASLVEPGSFDLQNIKGQEIPGISLFLVLPGPLDSVEAFDLMLAAARTLTQSLNGELLDESGSTLSIQRERYLREEIIQFQHSFLVS
ncbi:MAG: cell division protein ZipA [Woeseiaceae bacterium]|nr:cell division protein ZipA [Woeseiaceae bacterium]